MNAIAYMLVTHSKTLLESTQTSHIMETLHLIIQVAIELVIIFITLGLIFHDLKSFYTDDFKGREGEDPQGPEEQRDQDTQNP